MLTRVSPVLYTGLMTTDSTTVSGTGGTLGSFTGTTILGTTGENRPSDVVRSGPAGAAHARLSPSAAHRWLACPASIRLTEQLEAMAGYVPPPDSEASVRGRLMHEVAEGIMNAAAVPHDLNEEERGIVLHYAQYLHDLVAEVEELGFGARAFFEERVRTSIESCWGTADCVLLCAETKEVWIIDLKTGHGRVSAERNTQLMIYATAFVYSHQEIHFDDAWRFHLVIIQPRDEDTPNKLWSCGMVELASLLADVENAERASRDPGIPPMPGDHCTYCPAATICPAVQSRTLSVFDVEGTQRDEVLASTQRPAVNSLHTPADPRALNANQMAWFLRHETIIRGFLDAVRERAVHEPPPGFKVVAATTRRRYRDTEAAVQRLIQTGHNELLRTIPPTITDLQRSIGTTNPLVMELVVQPQGAPTVVPEDDPRPAITPGAQVFRVEGPSEP
jgi:hypothetical protein